MERRQLTLMFTDIVGYSRLMGANESQTIGLLDEYRRILLTRIQEFRGSVIEFIGDAVFARFDAPLDAVNAGIAIQNDLGTFNANAAAGQPALRTRIGIHTGDVTLKDGSHYGDDVNIAARLEPIAVADGLCVSECVYKSIKNELKAPVKSLGVQALKNIDAKIHAYLIRPAGITFNTHAHYALRTFQQKIQAYRYPLALALVCIIAAGFYLVPRWLVPGYTANYVEIADFKSLMSENGEPDYFSAGITEALRSQLADMDDVYILDPSKGVRGPVRVEGSIQKIGESLRIAYRLFRRKDNVQIAGGQLDGAYNDIFILQDRIVAEIGRYLAQEFDLKFFRPAALNLTADVTAYDYYLKGMEYLRLPETHENFDQAIKYMTTALVHDGEFAGANAGICRAYRGKYKLTQDVGMLDKAEEYCRLSLAQDENQSDVHLALGMVFYDRGLYDDAVESFSLARELNPKDVEPPSFLAGAYESQNKFKKAESVFLEVIEGHPLYWRGYYEYSYFLASIGRLQEAVNILKKGLEFAPENEPALSNLGIIYSYMGEFEKAALAFEKAADTVPSAVGFSNAATSYYYAGDYQRSADAFRRAIQLSPEDYRLYLNFADSLRQLENKENIALENYQRCINKAVRQLEIDGGNGKAHQYMAISYLYLGAHKKAERSMALAAEFGANDIETLYAQVRYWVILEDTPKALGKLEPLLAAGFSLSMIERDPDMAKLVSTQGYTSLFHRVQNNTNSIK